MSTFVAEGAPVTVDSLSVIGENGSGFLKLPTQTTSPTLDNSNIQLYNDSSNNLSFMNTSGYSVSIDSSGLTTNRIFSVPDSAGEIVTDSSTVTLSNKTILVSNGNTIEANNLYGSNITGTPSNGDVLHYDAGEWTPLTLSAGTPLNYASGNFTISVGATSNTVAAGNDGRFSTAQIVKVKNTAAGSGEFTTISAALASISDNSSSKRYLIEIGPGTYVSGAIQMKPYVSIRGSGIQNTIIAANSNSISLFTMASNSSIYDVTLSGLSGTTDIAITINSNINASIRNIVMQNFNTLILAKATSNITDAIIFACYGLGSFTKGINIDGRAITGTNNCTLTVTNFVCSATPSTVAGIYSEGPYAFPNIASVRVFGSGTNGIYLADGTVLNTAGSQISECDTAILIANVGAGPVIRASSVSMFDNTTKDLDVQHPGATGVFSGIADQDKVTVDPAANISMFFTDPNTSGSVIVGDLYYGPATGESVTEIGDLITYTSPLGEDTSGGNVTISGGLDVEISSGLGYICQGVHPNEVLKKLQWTDSVMTLQPNTTHYIYAGINGLDYALSIPNKINTILLARVKTTSSDVEFIDRQTVNSHHWFQNYLEQQRDIFGVTYHTGSQVTANASRELSISSGVYYYLLNNYQPTGQASPAQWYSYYHVSGVFDRSLESVISNTLYDNLTDLTAISAGKFVRHVLYIVGDGVREQYFLVYGQEQFDTLLEAENGNNPSPPSYFEQGIVPIAAIIVQEGQSTIQAILDIRPRLGVAAAASASVTNHGDLSGLLSDDHPQYLLVNGSRSMSGDLDLGTNDIINVTTVNGINIDSHASRHLPNGSDPLTTAAPLTTLSSATTNSIGTANSFARSDHTHAVDISGFSITGLTGTLTVPKGGTGNTSLTSGNFLIGAGTSAVTTSKVAPTGVVVGDSDTQTLTNKTIVGGSSGNDIAANKILGVSVSATPPTANQVIVASSGTAASWSTIGDSTFSGTLTVPKGGTGNSSLTSGNFLIGAGTSAVTTSKVAPTGTVVGDSDTQTLTNKTITGGSSGNDIAANKLLGVTLGITAPVANQVLLASGTSAASWSTIGDSTFSGTLTVPKGGTGNSSLTSGNFLIGAGTSAVTTSKVAPSGVVVGDSDTQTLTNKTITGGSSGNDIAANKLLGVTLGITAPVANQVLLASGTSAASWSTIGDSTFSGTLTVPKGGTGTTSLTSGNFLIGAGTSAVTTSKVAPSGVVVGDSDTQTLTNKTITGGSSGNDIAANKILGVVVSATPPTANQVIVASSGTAASWSTIGDSTFSGTLTVPKGGTGNSSLTSGNFLIGAGTSAVTTSKVAPTGVVVGDTDVQTLTNKTIAGGSSGNDITANKILGVTVSATPPSTNQVIVASSGTAASWSTIGDSTFSGTLTVPKGGTGNTSLTSGNFLIGAGTSAVTTSKVAPTGVVVGDSDTQTLTNKTLLSATNTIDATRLQTRNISTTAPTNGQVLAYNSTSVQWEPTTSTGGGSLASQRWTIKDVKTVGTNGGASTANTWVTRTLNTLAGSADTSVTLASNQITFTTGTYFIQAAVPSHRMGLHKARLRNITSSTDIAYGTSMQTSNTDNTDNYSMIREIITFGSNTVVEIQHYGTRTQSDGFGVATGIVGTNEIYTTVIVEKLN